MVTLSLNGLTSHVNLYWMDNWNLIQLSCLSAAKVLTKTEAIPQSETTDDLQTEWVRRAPIEHEDVDETWLVGKHGLGPFHSTGLDISGT